MANQAKLLRAQLRQIVKEILPELLNNEFYTKLQAENKVQMERLHGLVKETLERMDDRQKTVQSLLMRELSGANNPKKEEPKGE